MEWSKYRGVWQLVMFDLPTDTKEARKRYTTFRGALLADGFVKMQYSIYMRHCPSEENAEVHFRRIKKEVPEEGEVRILQVTDKQFERMKIFYGKMEKPPEEGPRQLVFF
jgi:CRISPR-associated protein Cas2